MAIVRNGSGRSIYQVGSNAVSEGTLTALNSPITLDVETTLAINGVKTVGNRGYISNDSTTTVPASILVEISHKAGSYLTQFTLAQGESFDLTGWDVAQIKLTRSGTDCAYRIHCW